MSMMYIIFRLVLHIVHLFCSLYFYTKLLYEKFKYYHLPYNQTSLSNRRILDSPKLPKHLTVVLGHGKVSFLDLAKLICWCILKEIPCVSFYDHTGKLQKNERLIKAKLYDIYPQIFDNVKWLNSDKFSQLASYSNNVNNVGKQANRQNGKNGSHKYKTKVKVLSYADGKTKIASLTKTLADAITVNRINEGEITSELLDKKLLIDSELPSPDIAIVFGQTMSTYGLLPWHTRVTEFFLVPKHSLSYQDFENILIQYSQCEQRYGK